VRAFIYARYSTDRQTESSIEDQTRTCADFAAAHGWQLAGEFVDRGISGAAIGNRPGVQSVLAVLTRGDVLLVNDLSRLSRSQDLSPLLARLRHRGVRVLGVQDGYDSDARTARMQAGLSGIMSEEFRSMVADRTRSALEQRARDGRPTGGKAFDDPQLVREIFSRFANGETLRAIAQALNARGVPSPGANWKARSRPRGKWFVSALHALLKNERYIGREIWNRSQWSKNPDTGKRIRRERPRDEWIVRECEPLVDLDTWQRAQARFSPTPGRGGVSSYVLSGILVCGLCGGKLIVTGGSQSRYVCGTRHGGGPAACSNGLSVPRKVAEKHVLAEIERDLMSPEAEEVALREMRAARAAAEQAPPAAEDRELVELERMVREGILSPDIARPSIDAARRKAAARRASPAEGLPWPTRERWRAAAAAAWDVLRGEDVGAARSLLRELVGEVRCVPDGQHLLAESAGRSVLLGTGSGLWIGSGGVLRTRIPTRRAA
jgi:site-specific DNA recombinase